jgi:hypothetical protein
MSDEMPQPPLHAVTDDSAADRLGDHESDPALRTGAARGVHHQRRTSRADPRPGHAAEVGRLVQACCSRKHREESGGAQAESLARPLPRRAERIARPARVRIRSRKPWVRLRRRLLGWKVRLLTGGLPRCSRSWWDTRSDDPAQGAGQERECRCSQRLPNGTGGSQTRQTSAPVPPSVAKRPVQPTRRSSGCSLPRRLASQSCRLLASRLASTSRRTAGFGGCSAVRPHPLADPPGKRRCAHAQGVDNVVE